MIHVPEPKGPSIAKRRAALQERIDTAESRLREARALLPLTTSDLVEPLRKDLALAEEITVAALRTAKDISDVRFLQGELSQMSSVLALLEHDSLWARIKVLEEEITEMRDFLATIPVPPKRPPEMPDAN
jgi:hypothetical protein